MAKNKPIFYSALMLTGVNLLLRLFGTSFQVYLSGRIGAEGIGLLQLVLSVGSMAMVAGMGGIRTATMYLTAEELGRDKKHSIPWVLTGCILYSALFSGTIALLVQQFSPLIAEKWIGDTRSIPAVRLFAVFLPVNCLCGVMTGYFTGANRIGTLAAIEVAEQLISMAITMLLLAFWAGHDAGKACLSVVMGGGLGACVTLSCLVFLRIREGSRIGKRIPMAKRLCQTALPLALADDLRTGISTVENLMVPRRLALYVGTLSPLAAYGTVCGMVFPILMFPAAFLFGLTELLIPELARCNAAGSQRRIHYLMGKSLRLALLYGALCAGILFLASRELCMTLYDSPEAAQYLKWFAPLTVMLYCDAVTDAMIKGLGQQKKSVQFNILTNLMDVVFLFVLLPRYGIFGYFVSFLVTHLINLLLSLNCLLKISRHRIACKPLVFTLAASLLSIGVAGKLTWLPARLSTFLAVFSGLLLATKVVTKEDWLWVKGLIQMKKAGA